MQLEILAKTRRQINNPRLRSMGFSWSKIFPAETRLFVVTLYWDRNWIALIKINVEREREREIFETSRNDRFWKWSVKSTIIVCKIKLENFLFFYYIIIRFVWNDVWRFPGDFARVINFFKNKVKKTYFAYVFDTSICICIAIFFCLQKINIRHAGTFIFSAATLNVIIMITKKKNSFRILNFILHPF